MINKLLETLRSLRLSNGLYYASTGDWYRRCWVRDTFYCSLPELKFNPKYYEKTYHTLLDYYINVENKYQKFTWLIKDPYNKESYRFPHPRMTISLDEIHEPWGHKQMDAISMFLYGIYLGESNGLHIIRNDEDRKIINLIIKMFESIEYWHYADSGAWEENEEIRCSSIGAVVSVLTGIRILGFDVKQELIDKGHRTLNELLPRETATRDVDLNLLSLIYPFNIVETRVARQIIANIEAKLLRDRGVIRYIGDQYYNITGEPDGSPEWCFGLSFLSLAYYTLGDINKAKHYARLVVDRTILNDVNLPILDKNTGKFTDKTYIAKCVIPEMFYPGTKEPNPNICLSWSNSMAILCLDKTGILEE